MSPTPSNTTLAPTDHSSTRTTRSNPGNPGSSHQFRGTGRGDADTDAASSDSTINHEAHVNTSQQRTKRLKFISGGSESPTSLIRGDLNMIKEVLQTQINELNGFQSRVSEQVTAVRESCDKRAENAAKFQESVEDRFEREARKCDLVFRGIPVENSSESTLRDIIRQLCASLKVDVTNRDIVFARNISARSTGSNREAVIIVRFSNQAVRRDLLNAFFSAKHVSTRLLGWGTDLRITASDNLTPRNVAIRKRALEFKLNGSIERFIVRDGLIHIQQGPNKRLVKILDLSMLDEFAFAGSLEHLKINSNASK